MNSLNQISLASLAVAALVLGGCGHKNDGSRSEADQSEAGVSYSAKHGLLVPPATAKFIGLQIVDVEARKIAATLQFSAQIYRETREARLASTRSLGLPGAQASGLVSPTDATLIREGQAVSIAASDTIKLPGRITTLNRALAKAGEQVEVLLTIADEKSQLAGGAFVSVTVPLAGEAKVASVPQSALLRTTEGDCVYTVNGDYFARTAVKLGVTDGEFTEVTDGLFAGDKVVVHPVMVLWMTELHNVNGGDACCIAPARGK